MQIETQAFLLGAEDIHSNKSGKDFVKFNFVIEGKYCGFFVLKGTGDKLKQSKPCAAFAKTRNPQPCVLLLDLDFTERGVFTNVRDIRE